MKNKDDVAAEIGALEQQLHATAEELQACEKALGEYEERFNATFHRSPVAIAIISAEEGCFVDVNEAFITLTGYERNMLIGQEAGPAGMGFLPEQSNRLLGPRNSKETGAPPDVEHQIRTRQGDTRTVLVATGEIALFGETHLLYTFYDITHHKELERDVLRVGDETRRRIASDLHDELGQQLVAAAFQSDALSDDLQEKGQEEEARRAQRIAAATRTALEHVRNLSRQLSPVPIEDAEGLADALTALAERVEETFSVPCHFRAASPVPVEEHETALHLYRIAQEAITNAIKHAHASEVTVSLLEEGEEHVLAVRDDGNGLREEELANKEGMGLRTMKYRADLIGAVFHLKSDPENGTIVECRFNGRRSS